MQASTRSRNKPMRQGRSGRPQALGGLSGVQIWSMCLRHGRHHNFFFLSLAHRMMIPFCTISKSRLEPLYGRAVGTAAPATGMFVFEPM
jgi:hypothetical protein